MHRFTARTPDDDSRKTLEQRAREAGLPAAHPKKAIWPFLVADAPAAKPEQGANPSVRPA